MELAARRKSKEAFDRAFQRLAVASRPFNDRRSKLQNPLAVQVWTAINAPLDGEGKFEGVPGMAYAVSPESGGFFRTLVFLKYGITFRALIAEIERNHSSYQKLIAIHRDYYRMLSGQTALDRLKLKFNSNHFSVILQGLDFGFKKLNEFQLADCLDKICPCCKLHSVEYFKKLRARIERKCKTMISSIEHTSWPIGESPNQS